MPDTTEIDTSVTPAEDNEEGGIAGRWESEDEADGTVFENEESE
ncbi:hypothetical protein [Nodularia chucula]